MKINFKSFLAEDSYKTVITAEEAINLIKEHCKESVGRFGKPMWRGSYGKDDCYVVHGAAGERVSANSENYYTNILDHFLGPKGYPLRSKSMICGNNENLDYVEGYGSVYAVFPYDSVPIGVVDGHNDIWRVNVKLGNDRERGIQKLNDLYRSLNLTDASYERFVKQIKTIMESSEPSSAQYILNKIFGDDDVEKVIEEAYDPKKLGLALTTPANIRQFTSPSECWIGGKCVLIQYRVWKDLVAQGTFK